MGLGPYAGVEYNLTYVHSRVDSNTFIMGNPMPESTLSPSKGLWIWPLVLYQRRSWNVRVIDTNKLAEHSFSYICILEIRFCVYNFADNKDFWKEIFIFILSWIVNISNILHMLSPMPLFLPPINLSSFFLFSNLTLIKLNLLYSAILVLQSNENTAGQAEGEKVGEILWSKDNWRWVQEKSSLYLKVVCNKKGGALGGWLLFQDGFGSLRSMSVCFLILLSSFL